MARLAQLHNSHYWIVVLILTLGCQKIEATVELNNPDLKKEKGVYYWNDSPLNGLIYELNTKGDTLFLAHYKQGIKNGITKKWWPNGQLKFEGNFEAGTYQGKVAEWYEDGTPYSVFNYDKGKEIGKQMAWKADGSIKANYEVIGDRKYGLTGVKNCKHVWDEE